MLITAIVPHIEGLVCWNGQGFSPHKKVCQPKLGKKAWCYRFGEYGLGMTLELHEGSILIGAELFLCEDGRDIILTRRELLFHRLEKSCAVSLSNGNIQYVCTS